MDRSIRDALRSRTAAYSNGLVTGNMDEYKAASYGVHKAVREAKRHYGKKLELQMEQSNPRGLWQGIPTGAGADLRLLARDQPPARDQLNVSKTKELIVGFSGKHQRSYAPVVIGGSQVKRVASFKYLRVNLSEDLTWSAHINTLVKKAHQRLYHLRRQRDFKLPARMLRNFYTCTIESILYPKHFTYAVYCVQVYM